MRPVTVILKDCAEKKCLRNIPSPESHNFIPLTEKFTSRIARSKNKLNAESWCLQAFSEKHNKPVPAYIVTRHPRNTESLFP
jgi:hypothetical protein